MTEAKKRTRKRRPTYKPQAQQTTIAAAVGDAFSAIQELRDEMVESKENMEEKLSHTDKYARIEECIETLESECDNEPDVPESVQELPVTYSEMVPARRGRGTSRATRLSNAIGMLEAARDYAQAWLDEEDRGDGASEVESMVQDLENAISSMEGADFPGMYG